MELVQRYLKREKSPLETILGRLRAYFVSEFFPLPSVAGVILVKERTAAERILLRLSRASPSSFLYLGRFAPSGFFPACSYILPFPSSTRTPSLARGSRAALTSDLKDCALPLVARFESRQVLQNGFRFVLFSLTASQPPCP